MSQIILILSYGLNWMLMHAKVVHGYLIELITRRQQHIVFESDSRMNSLWLLDITLILSLTYSHVAIVWVCIDEEYQSIKGGVWAWRKPVAILSPSAVPLNQFHALFQDKSEDDFFPRMSSPPVDFREEPILIVYATLSFACEGTFIFARSPLFLAMVWLTWDMSMHNTSPPILFQRFSSDSCMFMLCTIILL